MKTILVVSTESLFTVRGGIRLEPFAVQVGLDGPNDHLLVVNDQDPLHVNHHYTHGAGAEVALAPLALPDPRRGAPPARRPRSYAIIPNVAPTLS